MHVRPCLANVSLPISIVFLSILISACQPSNARLNDATRTLQADRSIRQATQMALTLEATRQAQSLEFQATRQAIDALVTNAQSWEPVFSDAFDEPGSSWPSGEDTDPLASISWQISGGLFRWEATANEPFVWWAIPEQQSADTSYLRVQAQQVEGPQSGEYGLIFRCSDDGDYYLFELNAFGEYAFYAFITDEWQALRPWKADPAIHTDQPNQLALLAQGSSMYLLVNDVLIDIVVDERLPTGSAGLLIGLSEAGDHGVWQFDDFELSIPQESSPGKTTDDLSLQPTQ